MNFGREKKFNHSVSLTVAFEQYPSLLTLSLSRKTPLQSTGPFMSPKTPQGLLPIQLCTVQAHFSNKRGRMGSDCDLLNLTGGVGHWAGVPSRGLAGGSSRGWAS